MSSTRPLDPTNPVRRRPYVWPTVVVHQADCATKDLDAWRTHVMRGVEKVQAHESDAGTVMDTSTAGIAGRFNVATARRVLPPSNSGIHTLCDCTPDILGWRFLLRADGTVDYETGIGAHYSPGFDEDE